jgi:glutamine synthetase adenylyltransferase
MNDQTTGRSDNDAAPPASSRQRAIETYEGAKERASDTLGEAPLLALAGGLAAGALIAALIPRTQTEARLVRPTARRVKDSARAAYEAARNTGSEHLDRMGLSREKGEETVRNLADGLVDAAKASANAAVEAVRNKS